MTINFTTLFTQLGKGIYAQKTALTAAGTTIPPEVEDYLDQIGSVALDLKPALTLGQSAYESWKGAQAALVDGLRSSMETLVVETVAADAALARKDAVNALAELIRQMVANSESVDASSVAASASSVTGNGDGVLVASIKRADGLDAQNAIAETIKITCTSDGSPETAGFSVLGEPAVDPLNESWPQGSGASGGLTAVDAANSLIANGDFEDEDDRANAPDGWIVGVGTIGTTIKLTDPEIQTIAISGPPTAGTYVINLTNAAGKVQSTAPLAYNASASAVESAIVALIGFEGVTVTSTGTSPNFTHTITYGGLAGNLSACTVTNGTTGGSFSINTTQSGTNNAYVGKALEFDSDGSQLTAIYAPLSLLPLRQYAFCSRMLADVVPAAGVITIDLVDGIGGSVIADAQSTNNSFTVDCTALTTSFAAKTGVFRTPRVLPSIVFLRIRITTAVSSGTSIFIDHAALAEMREIYRGGPSAAIFSGKTPFTKGTTQQAGDYFTITVTNNRAGEFMEWFDRNFEMRQKGLILPSDSGGSETQADSLIA